MTQKLTLTKGDFDPDELDVEWEDNDFDTYDGEQPPSGTVLRGYIKKVWWTWSSNDNAMLVVLWIASGNTGKNAQYDGLPIWDRVTFVPAAAFRYGPFLQVIGVTLNDIFKKTYLSDDDDSNGAPVEKIGKWKPGESAECGVVTKREKYEGNWRTNVGKYIDNPDADDDEDDDEDDEPRGGRRTSRSSKPATKRNSSRRSQDDDNEEEDETDDETDDDEEEDEQDEQDEQEAKPARGSSRSSRTSSSSSASSRPTSSARGGARSRAAGGKTAPASKRRRGADDDDDPF